MTKKPKSPLPTKTGELAAKLGVTRKTVLRWRKRSVPLNDLTALAEWASAQRKLPGGFLARVMELRDGKPASVPKPVPAGTRADPEWVEFQQLAKAPADPKAPMTALARAREFCAFRFQKASAAGDKASMRFFSDLLIRFEGAVHDAEIRARKLNLDSGDLYPGSELDRLGIAIGFWLRRGSEDVMTQLSNELTTAAAAGPLDRETVRKIVTPIIIAERVLRPLARATQINAGVRLAPRLVDGIRTGMASLLENGAEEFDRARAEAAAPIA